MAHIFLNTQGCHFDYQLGSDCVNCVTSKNNEKAIFAVLNIAGIPRMSSVTIFQSITSFFPRQHYYSGNITSDLIYFRRSSKK